MKKNSRKLESKQKTFTFAAPKTQYSDLHVPNKRKTSLHKHSVSSSQIFSHQREGSSISDSESSDGSCLEKKFYRCGCQNQNGSCGHKYQNYLAELREERIRKKNKMIEYFKKETEKSEEIDLVLSDDDRVLGE